MRAALTTAAEVAGLGLVCACAFGLAGLWTGLGVLGVALLLVGVAEGRK